MSNYIAGATIKTLREKKKYTQKQLGEILDVSDKTISKWETEKGLPDLTLIEPLAKALGISVAELLSGECLENQNKSGNLLRSKFYVCPVCGNIIHSTGQGAFSCCGIQLPPLEAEEPDQLHRLTVEPVENEHFITLNHPMEKSHYISFIAYVTGDRVQMVKLYPEQNPEARFLLRGHGKFYAYCNKHGFFQMKY